MDTILKENFKVVIVGHVDHGKSTFIGRLLCDTDSIPPDKMESIEKVCKELGKPLEFAFVVDQIREERERGITIDTTQTYFFSEKRDYVIIDAPGHKEFMKNMITGASQAEGSILVLDAHEGVREQTRRHAYVLAMLGLKENIIILNKMDMANYSEERFNEVKKEITDLYISLGMPFKFIIPVSAFQGDNVAIKSENMNWYTGPTVLDALDSLKKIVDLKENEFRMPVQDIYNRNGNKIIVGRVESGSVSENDSVILQPGNIKATIDRVLEFGHEKHSAEYGENTGVTLKESVEIKRGNMLSSPSSQPVETKLLHGTIFSMTPLPIIVDKDIVLRCNTQEVDCRIKKILKRVDSSSAELLEENANQINETEVGEVIIETTEPVYIETFSDIAELGRFVLEYKGHMIAGGVITATTAAI